MVGLKLALRLEHWPKLNGRRKRSRRGRGEEPKANGLFCGASCCEKRTGPLAVISTRLGRLPPGLWSTKFLPDKSWLVTWRVIAAYRQESAMSGCFARPPPRCQSCKAAVSCRRHANACCQIGA